MDIASKLEEIAKSKNTSVSELIREAVQLLVDDSLVPEFAIKNWHIINIIVKNRPAIRLLSKLIGSKGEKEGSEVRSVLSEIDEEGISLCLEDKNCIAIDLDSREVYVIGESIDSRWDNSPFKIKLSSSIIIPAPQKRVIYVMKDKS
ncbi:CopG DNA-binding domain protein [Sulfolobus islandicus M.16.4]|nr:CopG DNA-binding domain protein [Sulfolobus islandicus M.16.4]